MMAKPEQHTTSEGLISTSMNFTDLKQALIAAGVPKHVLFNASSKIALIAIAQSRGLLSAGASESSSTSVASALASNRLSRANDRGSSPRLQAVSLAQKDQEIKALRTENAQKDQEMLQKDKEIQVLRSEIEALRHGAPADARPDASQPPTAETPADIASTAWLLSIGTLEAQAEALARLLADAASAAEKAERLREPAAVQEAIEGSVQKLAGLVCDAASREAEKHRAAQGFSPETIKDAPTRALFEAALGLQAQAGTRDAFAGAKHLYSPDGLPPWMWGISKEQFSRWVDIVRAAHDAGKITSQPDSTKPFYYPQERFDSREVGPNMHQVNRDVIKPMSAAAHGPLPGVSTALGLNLSTGGVSAAHSKQPRLPIAAPLTDTTLILTHSSHPRAS